MEDEKPTNKSPGLVCGAGRQMDVEKGTKESLRLVCGAGRQMGGEKTTNEPWRLVRLWYWKADGCRLRQMDVD